jgi:hypothetical protein
MKKIIFFCLFFILTVDIFIIKIKQKHDSFKPNYEQGLRDGFIRTLKYLEHKNYLTKDTVIIKNREIDSVLHLKNK